MKNKKEKSCSLNKFIMFLYNHRGLSVRIALNVFKKNYALCITHYAFIFVPLHPNYKYNKVLEDYDNCY